VNHGSSSVASKVRRLGAACRGGRRGCGNVVAVWQLLWACVRSGSRQAVRAAMWEGRGGGKRKVATREQRNPSCSGVLYERQRWNRRRMHPKQDITRYADILLCQR